MLGSFYLLEGGERMNRELFQQYLKEAKELCRDGFLPALDDLQEEKIDYEIDQVVMKEAEVFMAKGVDYIENER